MLSALIATVDTGEFEDNGSLFIDAASARDSDLVICLRLNLPDGSKDARQVLCRRPRSYELMAAECADNLSVSDDHVLLWPHTQKKAALYFNGRADDSRSLLGALVQMHFRTVGEWFPFTTFMNDALFSPSCDLLGAQSGLLADGPEPLIDSYAAVLDDFGIRHSTPPPRAPGWWDGVQWQHSTEKLHVLIIGRSYVVAPEFAEDVA